MIQRLIIRLLIRFYLSKIELKKIIRLLGILECGFHDFCYKKSLQALDENRLDLSDNFLRQAFEEDLHARMLWSLADGLDRPRRDSEHKQHHGVTLENSAYFVEGAKTWQSTRDGKTRQWQNTDGISVRYASARAFFMAKKAEDYNWANALAFMCVGECLGTDFYSELAQWSLAPTFLKIAEHEKGHMRHLWKALKDEVGLIRAYLLIIKWNVRKFLAFFSIPYDLRQIFKREETRS